MLKKLEFQFCSRDWVNFKPLSLFFVLIKYSTLGEIDTINEKFSCDATLFITWRENADVLKKCDTDDDNSYYWDSKNLWDPQLYSWFLV